MMLAGCTSMVASNTGDTVTLEHDAWTSVETAAQRASESCRQAGRSGQVSHITTVSKNPSIPVGSGVQLSTFTCR